MRASSWRAAGGFWPALESRKRETLAQLSYTELTRSLIHSFIGSNQPHRAQVEALDALADHQSVLAVMGTGRGKSLIFHVHAAREAVLRGRASIFVYPLRALVADQAITSRRRWHRLALALAC